MITMDELMKAENSIKVDELCEIDKNATEEVCLVALSEEDKKFVYIPLSSLRDIRKKVLEPEKSLIRMSSENIAYYTPMLLFKLAITYPHIFMAIITWFYPASIWNGSRIIYKILSWLHA